MYSAVKYLVALGLACAAVAHGQTPLSNRSLGHEVSRALSRGIEWLEKNQSAEGHWSTPDHPAVTALALIALQAEPTSDAAREAKIRKGYDFLTRCVQENGSVHNGKGLVNYNTSLALLAFAAAKDGRFEQQILRGRKYLIGTQIDQGEKGVLDSPFDGGAGYGSKYEHSDMGNTLQALEALYYTRQIAGENTQDLNWKAAIHFLQNCQNLPSHNKQAWVSGDPQNKGGFIYFPGRSMAGETNLPNGRVALRSYGSISYAGLLSYIYADLDKNDPRVQAVFDWLKDNYTLEENPGMGQQGLYYYFHTMAKALTAYGVRTLPAASETIPWRDSLALRLINLQREDGSWKNDNARWWENDPALVTSYGVITLRMIARGL